MLACNHKTTETPVASSTVTRPANDDSPSSNRSAPEHAGVPRSTPGTALSSCPVQFKSVLEDVGDEEYRCHCKANHYEGPIWGYETYSADSSICQAAIHMGVIEKKEGGAVTVKRSEGCPVYREKVKNGLHSSAWGAQRASFYFPGHGDGTCAEAPKKDACPNRFAHLEEDLGRGSRHECSCVPFQIRGPAYGTDLYTGDSSVCVAAVHAGAIDDRGGRVVVKPGPKCARFNGTKRNGIDSRDYRSTRPANDRAGFWFEGHGNGSCFSSE